MTEYKQGRFLAVALIIAAAARPALLSARTIAAAKTSVVPAFGVVGPPSVVFSPLLAPAPTAVPALGVSVLAAPVVLTPALAAVAASDKQAVSGLKTAVRSLTSLQRSSAGDAVRAASAELGRLFENASAGGSPEGPFVGASLGVAVRSLESIVELKVGFYNVLNFFAKVGKHVPDPDNPGRLKKVSDAKPKPEWAVREQGRIILENDLDIVTLAEVENIVALEDFNERYLGGAYHAYLIEGNDERGIDIAFLVKKDLPFVIEQRSHKDETWVDPILGGGPKTLFSRDLTALVIRAPGKDSPLFVIFGTHYKSKRDRDRRDSESTILRAAQVRRSAEIIARYRKEFGPEVPIMVAGDFNGSVGREAAFDPLFKAAGLTDSFDASSNPPSDRDRITHTYHPSGGVARSAQMDAVLVSKALRAAVKSARVYRYKNPDGTVRPIPKTYEEREKNPSDHFPVIVALDFALMRTVNASGVEAEDDEIAAMMPMLNNLRTAGYVVLEPGALIPEGLKERVAENISRAARGASDGTRQDFNLLLGDVWKSDLGARPDGSGGIREVVETATALLNGTLRGEGRLRPRWVQVRRIVGGHPAATTPHVDSRALLTLSLALRGPGTLLYPSARRADFRQAAEGSIVFVTNAKREERTGIPGTVHAAPSEGIDERIVLLVHFEREDNQDAAGASRVISAGVALRIRNRVEAVMRALNGNPAIP